MYTQWGFIAMGRISARRLLALALLSWACAAPVQRGMTLRIVYPHQIVSLDPFAHDDQMTHSLMGAVYEPLVHIGPELAPEPALAVSWETPDELTWRLRLRSGVLFHNGTPLTATAVVRSIQHAAEAPGSALATYLTAVKTVDELPGDPKVVEIRTRWPALLMLARLSMVPIVPDAVLRDPSRPLGTGPYRWTEGSTTGPLRLHVWGQYWGPRPMAEDIVIDLVDDDGQSLRMLEQGTVDVVSELPRQILPGGAPPRGWHFEPCSPLSTTMLGCNVERPPMDDPRVRQALDLALDRPALAQAARPTVVEPAYRLVPPSVVGSTYLEQIPASNPARARSLLAEAGFPEGVEITLDYARILPPVAQELQAQLARAGIRLRLRQIPYDQFYARIMERRCTLYLFGWSFPLADASDLLEGLAHRRDPEKRLGLQNGSGYGDPEVDSWIERTARAPREDLRMELIQNALKRLEEDRPYIPLFRWKRFAAVRDGLTIKPYGTGWLPPQRVFPAAQ